MASAWQTVRWIGDRNGVLELLDQTRLPLDVHYTRCSTKERVWEAIRSLRVRGAPAIGIAAAYGVVLGMQQALNSECNVTLEGNADSEIKVNGRTEPNRNAVDKFLFQMEEVCQYLATSRPTAVNLSWALERLKRRANSEAAMFGAGDSPDHIHEALLNEAVAIHDEDRSMCRAIGRYGAELLSDGDSILTHCNSGGLATSEYGTALAVIFAAVESGKRLHVWVDETRPLLQGARLTVWELMQREIPCTLLCDSMAAQLMASGRINAVIVGADRIAANGDTANKIGTYGLAILASAHHIPFYVAAPSSTLDLSISSGMQIPIEHRGAEEVTHWMGQPIAPSGVSVYNPAFDVTPHSLISAIITEKGVCRRTIESSAFEFSW